MWKQQASSDREYSGGSPRVELSLIDISQTKKTFLQEIASISAGPLDPATTTHRPNVQMGRRNQVVKDPLFTETVSAGYNHAAMYNKPKYSDFKLSTTRRTELYMHKTIVGTHSGYFDQLFESKPSLVQPNIALNLQVPAELNSELEHVVKFLYNGEVTMDKYSVFRFLFLAELILCDDLKQLCITYLKKHTSARLINNQLQFGSQETYYSAHITDVQISQIVQGVQTYTAEEMHLIWQALTDTEICDAVVLWFAGHLNIRNPNFVVAGFDLTSKLTYEQVCALLDCDAQAESENSIFTFATKWLDKHDGKNAEPLLLKIRYAYMNPAQRHQALLSQYVRGSSNLIQAVITGAFWSDQLQVHPSERTASYSKDQPLERHKGEIICMTAKDPLKEICPFLNGKAYKPRLYTLQQ